MEPLSLGSDGNTPSSKPASRFGSVARAGPRRQPNYFAVDTFSTLQQPNDHKGGNKRTVLKTRNQSIDKGSQTLGQDYPSFLAENSVVIKGNRR